MAILLILNMILVALSGCLFFEEDGPEEEEDQSEQSGDGTGKTGSGGAGGSEGSEGNETDEGDPGTDTPPPGRFNGTVLDGNLDPVAQANLTLRSDEDGTETETSSDEDGAYLFEVVAPGSYNLTVNATCCSSLQRDVEIQAGENMSMDFQLVLLEPDPEGGQATGAATGASIVSSSRASFELTSDEHVQLELIPESNDPVADLGESYSLRIYLPDGEEENYDAENGEPIVTESVMKGEYEITIWPVVAGSIEYTVDWCAYTSTHCDD